MEKTAEIKASILAKFDELLSAALTSLEAGEKFSSAEIGKEIGKFITQEVKDIRKPRGGGSKKTDGEEKPKEKKSDDEGEKEEKPKKPRKSKKNSDEDEEKPEKPKRKPSNWNLYMKAKMAELKAKNEEDGTSKKPKEMLVEIAEMWKDEKSTWSPPNSSEDEKDT